MVVIANSFPIGIIGVWGPVLGVNLKQLDVSQVSCSVSYVVKLRHQGTAVLGHFLSVSCGHIHLKN